MDCFARFVLPPYILGNERRHGLHQRTWNQHRKVYDLAGNAVTGRSLQSESIDKRTECQKRNLGQKFLKRQWKTDLEEFLHCGFRQKSFFVILNGRSFYQKDDRKHNAECLCSHRCNCRTCCIHVKSCDQYQVTDHVNDTCYQNKQKW